MPHNLQPAEATSTPTASTRTGTPPQLVIQDPLDADLDNIPHPLEDVVQRRKRDFNNLRELAQSLIHNQSVMRDPLKAKLAKLKAGLTPGQKEEEDPACRLGETLQGMIDGLDSIEEVLHQISRDERKDQDIRGPFDYEKANQELRGVLDAAQTVKQLCEWYVEKPKELCQLIKETYSDPTTLAVCGAVGAVLGAAVGLTKLHFICNSLFCFGSACGVAATTAATGATATAATGATATAATGTTSACAAGLGAASWCTLGAMILGGLLVGALIGCAGYAAYKHMKGTETVKLPSELTRPKPEHFNKLFDKLLTQMPVSSNDFPPASPNALKGKECRRCHVKLTTCETHEGPTANHHPDCGMCPFRCQHLFCFKCVNRGRIIEVGNAPDTCDVCNASK